MASKAISSLPIHPSQLVQLPEYMLKPQKPLVDASPVPVTPPSPIGTSYNPDFIQTLIQKLHEVQAGHAHRVERYGKYIASEYPFGRTPRMIRSTFIEQREKFYQWQYWYDITPDPESDEEGDGRDDNQLLARRADMRNSRKAEEKVMEPAVPSFLATPPATSTSNPSGLSTSHMPMSNNTSARTRSAVSKDSISSPSQSPPLYPSTLVASMELGFPPPEDSLPKEMPSYATNMHMRNLVLRIMAEDNTNSSISPLMSSSQSLSPCLNTRKRGRSPASDQSNEADTVGRWRKLHGMSETLE